MRKPRKDSRLKTLHPAEQKKLWDFIHEPGVGYEEAIPFCKKHFGFEPEESSLSGWRAWYPLGKELSEAASLKEEIANFIRENPTVDLDADQLSKAGQAVMEMRALRSADPAHFIAMRNLRLRERNLDLEMQKYRDSLESKIDAGLKALHAEIKGNEEAETLFKRFRAIVRKAAK